MNQDWQQRPLGELTELVIDYRGKTPLKLGGDWNPIPSGYRALSARNIKTGKIVAPETIRYVNAEIYKKWMKDEIQKGDILITSEAPFGEVYYWNSDEKIVLSQRLFALRVNSKIDSSFLYHYMTSNEFQAELRARATGTTVTGLRQPELLKCCVKFPAAKPTQVAIARILSTIDDKIELNTQINHNLEEQAKAFLEYNEQEETLTLGEIFSFVNGFPFKSGLYVENGDYKVITIKNVQDGKIDSRGADTIATLPEKMKFECVLHPGDILLSLTGNVGRTGIIYEDNLLLNQRVAKIIEKESTLHATAYFILRMPSVKVSLETMARGTAQANLSPVEMLNISVPFTIPTLKKIALLLTSFFEQIVKNEQEIVRLAQLRDSLLPKLMSGEIDVSEVEV